MNIFPSSFRILALIFAAGLTAGAIYAAGISSGQKSVQGQWDKAKAAQLKAALSQQATWQKQLDEAQHAAKHRETKLRENMAAARATNHGLHDTLAELRRRLPASATDACAATADTLGILFGACSKRLVELADQADGHASDVQTLTEAWPK